MAWGKAVEAPSVTEEENNQLTDHRCLCFCVSSPIWQFFCSLVLSSWGWIRSEGRSSPNQSITSTCQQPKKRMKSWCARFQRQLEGLFVDFNYPVLLSLWAWIIENPVSLDSGAGSRLKETLARCSYCIWGNSGPERIICLPLDTSVANGRYGDPQIFSFFYLVVAWKKF